MMNGILFLFIILVSMFLSEKAVSEAIRKIETYYADKLDFKDRIYSRCLHGLHREGEFGESNRSNAESDGKRHKIWGWA